MEVFMKTKQIATLLSLVLLSTNCERQVASDQEKKQALEVYAICTQMAKDWLIQLDSSDYTSLYFLQPPYPMNIKGKVEDAESYIRYVQTVYGKVDSRQLRGAHLWLGRKLLTYAPDIEDKHLNYINASRSADGFYIVKPRYFGLRSHAQMFKNFPPGNYVIMMYQSSSEKKTYEEEEVILWLNPEGNWQVAGYVIADEI